MLNLLLESTPLKQIYLIENSIELQIRQKTDTKKKSHHSSFLKFVYRRMRAVNAYDT